MAWNPFFIWRMFLHSLDEFNFSSNPLFSFWGFPANTYSPLYCKPLKNKEKYQFMSLLLQLAILHVRLFSSPGFYLHIARKQGLVVTKMTFTSVFIFLAKMNSFAYSDITVEEISKIRNSRPKKSFFFSRNLNTKSAKIDCENDNNNNNDLSDEFKGPSGEGACPKNNLPSGCKTFQTSSMTRHEVLSWISPLAVLNKCKTILYLDHIKNTVHAITNCTLHFCIPFHLTHPMTSMALTFT